MTTEPATGHDIATLPKAELHVHLGGTITEATATTLARRHGADPECELIPAGCSRHSRRIDAWQAEA